MKPLPYVIDGKPVRPADLTPAQVEHLKIPAEGLRINLGCGKHTLDGWFCVDKVKHPQASRDPDLYSDVSKLDLPDACAIEIMAIHVFEHFYRWECDDLLVEWKRLLRPGGKLALEMPDLLKTCRNIVQGRQDGNHKDQMGLWGLYGDPRTKDPLMIHRWAWTFKTIRELLAQHGFTNIAEEETKWHPNGRGVRDFRVTARKA